MKTQSRWLLLFVILSLISLFCFPSTSYASSSWMKFFRKDTLLNTYMRSYAVDGDRLWVGTYGDGLVIYNGRTTKSINMKNTVSKPGTSDGLVSDLVTCISIDDKENRVWVGTNQGLSSCNLQGESWRNFTEKEGLPNNVIRDVAVDEKGMVWVATPSGVSRYDGEKWETFNAANGLEDENIQTVSFSSGSVWAASVGGTVARYDGHGWYKVLFR